VSRGCGWWLCYYHWAEREKRVLPVLRRDMAGFVVGVGVCLAVYLRRVLEESIAQDLLTYIILGGLFGQGPGVS
jgi:hypothetical protein